MSGEDWINPNEYAGLPRISDLRTWLGSTQRIRKVGGVGSALVSMGMERRSAAEEYSGASDIESTTFNNLVVSSCHMRGRVLFALLTIYNHPNVSQSTLSPTSQRNSIVSNMILPVSYPSLTGWTGTSVLPRVSSSLLEH